MSRKKSYRAHTGQILSKRQVAAYLGIARKQNRTVSQAIEYYTNPKKVRVRRRVTFKPTTYDLAYRSMVVAPVALARKVRAEKVRTIIKAIPRGRKQHISTQIIAEQFQAPKPKPAPGPKVKPYISTRNLRGFVEKYFDSVAVGKPIKIQSGWTFHSDLSANLKYEQVYFFTHLQTRETYLLEIDEALKVCREKSKAWFDARFTECGFRWPATTYVRWRLYIRNPETNEIRDLWGEERGPLPIRGTGRGQIPMFEFDADYFDGMVSEHYWEGGYLVAGIGLYEFTVPLNLDYYPSKVRDAYRSFYAQRESRIRAEKTQTHRAKTVRRIRHRGTR